MLTQLLGNRVSRSEIYQLTTPPGTETHVPVPHSTLLDLVDLELHHKGIEVVESEHVLDNGGSRYFGLFALKSNDGIQHTFLGLRNSHDMSVSASIVTGSRVFVCSNLMFDGEIKLGLRHTLNIQSKLPNMIDDAISRAINITSFQKDRLDNYRTTKITNNFAENLIIDIWRKGAIPAASIAKIVNEFEEPSHDEFLEDGKSIWRLQNAITEIIRPKSANLLHTNIHRTQKVVQILDNAVRKLNWENQK
jgi:hypothetical protein